MHNQRPVLFWIGVLLFTALFLFLSFNKHSKAGYFNYHSEIWSDKAGYSVYLPATFKFGFDARIFPDSIAEKTGYGFELDRQTGKVITKYTYAVALMQSPFYLIADLFVADIDGFPVGFSKAHHAAINLASVFYLVAGLVFLYFFLANTFHRQTVLMVLFSVFAGTNLFYYGIFETGMSHVYSFAAFSLLLFTTQRTNYMAKGGWMSKLAIGALVGLILVLRPTHLIFVLAVFVLGLSSVPEFRMRVASILKPGTLILLAVGVIAVALPQMAYWNYTYGSPLVYSYGKESFHWFNPQVLKTLFSPNNGLFLYCPFFILILVAIAYFFRQNRFNGYLLFSLFVIITWVFSAWWDWSFGCGFGARNYVEYLAVFSIPLAHLYTGIRSVKQWQRVVFWIVVWSLIVFNLKMIYSYDVCYYGKYAWDWKFYTTLVTAPTK